MERYLKPIKYGGKEISNFEDIAEFISFPALNRERIKAAPKQFDLPAHDEQFDKLTLLIKPKVDYYKMSLGDRQLYLRRVDKLTYDIAEEEELRRARKHELELEKARQEQNLLNKKP